MPRDANKKPTKHTSEASSSQSRNDEQEAGYKIISVNDWIVKKHICGIAKPNKNGQGKTASLSYSDDPNKDKIGNRFFLRTPKMTCPFGASKPKLKPNEAEKDNPQWGLQMSFTNDAVCLLLQKKVEEFDQFMIDEGVKPDNCVGWLGSSRSKLYSKEVVESKYSNMLKKAKKDGEETSQYPPFIRVSFPTTYKAPYEFTCEIYDYNGNIIKDVSTNPNSPNCISKVIPPGSCCSALISGSIWCNTNGYGVSWKVAQIKVFPAKGIPKGKCLLDDPEDAEETEKNKEKMNDEKEVEDEDEEEVEEEVEDEDEPVESEAPL